MKKLFVTYDSRTSGPSPAIQLLARFKAFLLKSSSKTNGNVYDHLTQVLVKIIEERPADAVDVIEDISHNVKRALYVDSQSTLRDLSEETPVETMAQQQQDLFKLLPEGDQEYELVTMTTLMKSLRLQIPHRSHQTVTVKKMTRARPSQPAGEIIGTERNYLIAEAEYREGEEEEEQNAEEAPGEEQEKQDTEMDSLPKWTYKPPPVVPTEAVGTGTNRYMYFVCNEPGLPWTKLPTVTPAQITTARLIRKFFTGRLDAPIVSCPPFPGNESNYLRAQIARISAGTQVSPQGFYQFREEEGTKAEEEVPQDGYEVHPEFEGVAAVKLAESLSAWVHHTQHILKQGRCMWVNLTLKNTEEEEEGEEREEAEPELGPPLLTPLSQDEEGFQTLPWTLRMSSRLTPEPALAFVRSNLWPGAYATGKKFENVYVGWGLKYTAQSCSPPVPPRPQREYLTGPDVMEVPDPTVEEEQEERSFFRKKLSLAWRIFKRDRECKRWLYTVLILTLYLLVVLLIFLI
uniref:Uncharacterized protein n=1 Tax=Knipowitschia caucasica TaxID=637954 RepID=A0AAV2JI10_KNICA